VTRTKGWDGNRDAWGGELMRNSSERGRWFVRSVKRRGVFFPNQGKVKEERRPVLRSWWVKIPARDQKKRPRPPNKRTLGKGLGVDIQIQKIQNKALLFRSGTNQRLKTRERGWRGRLPYVIGALKEKH